MYGSNHENVNWNMGINKKQASKQKVENRNRNRCNAVSCQRRKKLWVSPDTDDRCYQGSSGTIQLFQEAEFDCPPSTPLHSTTVTTTTPAVALSIRDLYVRRCPLHHSNPDAKLDFKVPGYDDYMYLLISNFTSAGTYTSASAKDTVGPLLHE